MKKLKPIVQYECVTSFKYIWIFYGIEYAIVSLITIIIGIAEGSFKDVGTSLLEMNTIIYVGILGVLGFNEDFKMLIQNGFTRKYIWIATVSMFGFISGIMAVVDTVTGTLFHYFRNGYESLYGKLYGYENLFLNWLWLFLLYMLICSFFYLGILTVNKIGKTSALYLAIALGGMILLLIALFRFVFPSEMLMEVKELFLKFMGFMPDGTIHCYCPVMTFLLIIGIWGIGSYVILQKTELK